MRAAVGLAVVAAALVLVPWSGAWLNRRIEQAVRDRLGLDLSLGRAVVRLWPGQVIAEAIALADPDAPELRLTARRLEVRGNALGWLVLRRPLRIDAVTLLEPSEARWTRRGGAVRAPEAWQHALERLARMRGDGRPSSPAPPRLQIGSVRIWPVTLALDDADATAPSTIAALRQGDLTIDFEEGATPRRLDATGMLETGSGGARPVRLRIEALDGPDQWRWEAHLDGMDSERDLPPPLPVRWRAREVHGQGTLARAPDARFHATASLLMHDAELVAPGLLAPRRLSEVLLDAEGSFDVAGRRIEVQHLGWQGPVVSMSLEGQWERSETDWRAPRRAEIVFALRVDSLDSEQDLALPGPLAVRCAPLDLRGELSYPDAKTPDLWRIDANVQATAMQWLWRDSGDAWDAGPAQGRLRAQAALGDGGRATIDELALEAGPVRLKLAGALGAPPRRAWELRAEALEIGGAALAWAARARPDWGRLDASDGAALRWTGALGGSLASGALTHLDGVLELSGVDWQPPDLPVPLRALRLAARATSTTLDVQQAAAVVSGLPVDVRGRLEGRLLDGAVDLIDLRWTTVGTVADAAGLLTPAQQQRLAEWELGGEINGEGRIVVRGPTGGSWARSLAEAVVSGELRFRRGVINVPLLPERLTDLQGRIEFSPTRVTLLDMSGRWFDLPFNVNGVVEGAPRFWRRPHAQLTLAGRFDVADALNRLHDEGQRRGRAWPELPVVQGQADVRIDLAAEAGAWHRPDWRVEARLEDVAATPTLPYVRGPLLVRQARLAVDPNAVRLDDALGRWGDLAWDARGAWDATGARIEAHAAGLLSAWRAAVPTLLDDFLTSGVADVRHLTRLAPLDAGRPVESPVRWLAARLADRPPDALWLQDAAAAWTADHEGTITLTGAELTHAAMPSFLRGINGLLRYEVQGDTARLWSPQPLPVQGGRNARGLRATIELAAGSPDRPPRFTFDVAGESFPLDEWLQPWHAPPPRGHPADAPPVPSDRPVFELRGTVRTGAVTFGSLTGRNFQGRIELDGYRGRPDELRWPGVALEFYGGRMTIDGAMADRRLRTRFDVQGVNLARLANDLTGREAARGVFSGLLDGWMDVVHDGPGAPATGRGHLEITESRFISNPLFEALARLPNLLSLGTLFRDVSFQTITGDFTMHGGVFASDNLTFVGPYVQIGVAGTAGPEGRLDLRAQVELLRIADRVPLVGEALAVFNRLLGRVIAVRVRGTLDRPEMTLL